MGTLSHEVKKGHNIYDSKDSIVRVKDDDTVQYDDV